MNRELREEEKEGSLQSEHSVATAGPCGSKDIIPDAQTKFDLLTSPGPFRLLLDPCVSEPKLLPPFPNWEVPPSKSERLRVLCKRQGGEQGKTCAAIQRQPSEVAGISDCGVLHAMHHYLGTCQRHHLCYHHLWKFRRLCNESRVTSSRSSCLCEARLPEIKFCTAAVAEPGRARARAHTHTHTQSHITGVQTPKKNAGMGEYVG
jgi:hypothetical protein